jgi:hypothetical protein
VATSSSLPQSGSGSESLTDVLSRGRMPLVGGLRCASEIARGLNEYHQQGRSYGRVTPASVVLKESAAELLPARAHWEADGQDADVASFGALLYELIMGAEPPVNASSANFRAPGPNAGLVGIRAAAMRLAGKCLGYFPVKLSMQQAATEVRLLWVVARQLEAKGAEDPPPMAAPFLVAPVVSKPKPPVRHEPEPIDDELDTDGAESSLVVPIEASHFTQAEEPKVGPKMSEEGAPCPKCDGAPVYISRPRTRFERMLRRWKIPICRCHRCYHRYILVAGMRIHKSMPKDMERRFRPKWRA